MKEASCYSHKQKKRKQKKKKKNKEKAGLQKSGKKTQIYYKVQ